MTDISKVKIQNFIESQIPQFLNADNPLFKEFLEQYYSSVEHRTGTLDLVSNLNEYKSIDFFNKETFYTEKTEPCRLTSEVRSFDSTINVNHTIGFPDKYGLLKIDNEIITYLKKTDNTFEDCIRGFSGITEIVDSKYSDVIFKETNSEFHSLISELDGKNKKVENLNIIFFNEFFRKFKAQFLPGFENREFTEKVDIQSLLVKIRDFYKSKGTEESYKLLFKILYDTDIDVITPKEYMLRPSDNKYFITNNILVEKIFGDIDPLQTKGTTLFQKTPDGIASGEIYNIEFRPLGEKNLYEISLDPEKNILKFISTKKTSVLEEISKDLSIITVDSTLGFPNSGKLLVKSKNLPSPFIISYQDKNLNQFLGVTGLEVDLLQNDVIIEPNFAYVDIGDNRLEFRVINVIDDIDYSSTSNLRVSDIISLSSFGANLNTSKKFTGWLYNISTTHKIKRIVPSGPGVWTIELFDSVRFTIEESIIIKNTNTLPPTQIKVEIIGISSENTIQVRTNQNINNATEISKIIKKASSTNYPDISSSISNIQNTYVDVDEKYVYVATSGLPDYKISADDRKIDVVAISSTTFNSIGTIPHSFYTGEKVYFIPEEDVGISSGVYYVSTIGDFSSSTQISLTYRDSDLFSHNYVHFPVGITGSIVKLDYENTKLKDQKIFKKIPLKPEIIRTDKTKSTNNKCIGILINGVELYSTTIFDENIYYGKLNNIQVTNQGDNYDVINTPELKIEDISGIGAKGHLNISGTVKDIKIIDPGYGYDSNIRLSITGGNGSGAELIPNIVRENITSAFLGNFEGVNAADNTIQFINLHNFEDGELIQYLPSGNDEIGYYDPISNEDKKLSENSFYYAGVISDTEIKLYTSQDDAINKINEIDLNISTSFGIQYFRTVQSKSVISDIFIASSGSNYSNKKVIVPSNLNSDDEINGVNLFDNYIYAKNHNFNDKDLVVYLNPTGQPISGLIQESKYHIKVIDENRFRLTFAGTSVVSEENFIKNRFIKFDSKGTGNHIFTYPPIEIQIEAYPETSKEKFKLPTLEPIVTGKIESVFLENSGSNYGVNNIINYHRRPTIGIAPITSEALIRPNIINGKIANIQILNSGRGYNSDIDLVVEGSGKFAELYPVLEDGRITKVNIINTGIGYSENTTIRVKRRGSGASFLAHIYEWKINQVKKNSRILNNSSDEGLLVPAIKEEPELQFIHFYPPKVLRRNVKDNIVNGDIEEPSPTKSPILGWSYDGFPIYGPYTSINGKIKNISSGYELSTELDNSLRPPINIFPDGFFIQDYKFNPLNEDGLDEYNGKYIINSDFPEGTYAYFYTIEIGPNGVSIPQYPYVVGKEFKNYPEEDNYNPNYNQNLDLAKLGLIRNTYPYYLNSNNSSYSAIDSVDSKYKQEFIVNSTISSEITDIDIYNAGDGYKVGELLSFDNMNSGGGGASGSVLSVKGKEVSSIDIISSNYNNISFHRKGLETVGVSTVPLDIQTGDYITISNVNDLAYKPIEGIKKINTYTRTVELMVDLESPSQPGVITSILPSDIIGFEVDDYIKIDDELAKILQIYPNENRIVIHRISDVSSHTAGISKIQLLPRKFTFIDNQNILFPNENTSVYFNPSEVISVGSSTKQYNQSNGVSITIPEKSIYIPNHGYKTNQPLIYNSGIGGTSLLVSNSISDPYFQLNDGQVVYVVNNGVNFIGLATGIGPQFSSLYFSDEEYDSGNAHILTTTFNEILGDITNYSVTISTKTPHELVSGDKINLNVVPKITDTIKFRYDTLIKKITTEKINFTSSDVSLDTSEILISTETLKTGDKVVYYSDDISIGGLENNETYFIIKTREGYIKLAEYYSDTIDGNYIVLTSNGSGQHSIAKINPKLSVIGGNTITFDLDDSSLEQTQLKLYLDSDFKNELTSYEYTSSDGSVYITSELLKNNKEIYYSFISSTKIITVDTDVTNYNSIEVINSNYTNEYEIIVIDDNEFKFNLKETPENIEYTQSTLSNLNYTTKSSNVSGPIDSIKLIYGGRGYKRLPKVGVVSKDGKNAVLKAKTKKIGRIDSTERIKDGFDYPSDVTLLPVLSSPAIVQVENISRVDYVGITSSGRNYNVAPSLKVIGNSKIKLEAVLAGKSVVDVKIIENTNDLTEPLEVIPIRNSNGYSINDIIVNGSNVTLELLNSDVDRYPIITEEYGSLDFVFPFEIGDQIFIERCRILTEEVNNNNELIIKDNYNSSDYNYKFFTVTGINTENYTITYSMEGVKDNLELGEYNSEFGYGYVVNKKDMAEFKMYIIDDLDYNSEEEVLGYDKSGTNVFRAKVLKDGWDGDINELRLISAQGDLKPGDIIEGQISRLRGVVTNINTFNLKSKLNTTRNKLNDLGDRVGALNDYYQRISDNDYYQKFSYSIKGGIPYSKWKEPVSSILHPSGFKKFSDLVVYNKADSKLKSPISLVDLTINIDNTQSFYTKNNFAMVTEDEQFDDGSIERIIFDEGTILQPYLLLKTNKVSKIDSISTEFTGNGMLEVISNKPVTFVSTDLYKLGVSTEGLNIGDKIGFSTYHFYPDSTYIFNIGEGYIELPEDTPHKFYSNSGISSFVVENLDFYRSIPGNKVIGRTTFDLKNNGVPLFYREFDSSDTDLIERSTFRLINHNFQTGQLLNYNSNEDPIIALATTTIGSGAILSPVFDENYSISKIKVIFGGFGYDSSSPPKIEIINTEIPHIEANFDISIESSTGTITNVSVANSGLGYYPLQSNSIGIVTTSEVEVRRDIIMEVGGGSDSTIYENGYNVAISTTIFGESAYIEPDFTGDQNVFWGISSPYIPSEETSGAGIGAKFSVFIVYNSFTGQPISTSIILRDGGRGYSVGDTVSIAGTYLGGNTPDNDLSFIVSTVSNTRIESEKNKSYNNIPGDTLVGYGTGAIFNVHRGEVGEISKVEIVSGGDNYSLDDNISIAGTYIGGLSPTDNLLLSPTLLGVDKLPNIVYVKRLNVDEFQLVGTPTTGRPIVLRSSGIGTHSFELLDQNVNTFITIDNIIQTPLHKKSIEFSLDSPVGYDDTIIYLTDNVYLLKLNDILKINGELIKVKNTKVDGENSVLVERAVLGSEKDIHSIEDTVYLFGGNYNVIKDKIHFTSAPYGPTGLPGLEVSSSFSGRVFSRRFSPINENDKNLILDDISEEFVGTGTTEFIIKSNGNSVVGLYTNTNSINGISTLENINNNPIILLNNIPQIGEIDYTIDTVGENRLKFLSGTPVSGKIITVSVLDSGFGYLPLVGAAATVSVSSSGQIDAVYINGVGSGYRVPPEVSIVSNEGSGAVLEAQINNDGTIDSITIISPGSGYSTSILPEIKIDEPENYYNLELIYADNYLGEGVGAKGSLTISNDSTVKSFILESSGNGYSVGDVLVVSGIATNPQSSSFEEFKVVVEEIFTDSITGWYPGQFVQFNDISNRFNGFRRRFNLSVTISDKSEVINLKSLDPNDIEIQNNLFVFINDILQVPNESYTFSGSRVIFREAPKAGTKCNIVFFRGSDLDVELVEPPTTIKEGDLVKINSNKFDKFDIPQFERVVKNIVNIDTLDTFPYDSVGINTDQNKIRPLQWTKQTKDSIINGVLYSKSRPNLKSNIIPTAKVIKSITTTDDKIYVDSAIPLFEDIDETRGIGKANRDIIVLDEYINFELPELKVNVGYAGTIESIDIINPGSSYKNITNPSITISPKFITKKDPLLNWSSNVGINTNINFNSIGYGNRFISVGSGGNVYFSTTGKTWEASTIIDEDIDFNDAIGIEDNYIVVGNSASAYRSFGLSNNTTWQKIDLVDDITIAASNTIPSEYTENFKKCFYDENKNKLIIVGEGGSVFVGSGPSPNIVYRYPLKTTNLDFNINSISSNLDYFVIVGAFGNIFYSVDGIMWQQSNSPLSNDLNDVIWDGSRFIAVANGGVIISSTDLEFWSVVVSAGIGEDILKINYKNGIYTILDSLNRLYFSVDLLQWKYRSVLNDTSLDIISVGNDNEEFYVSVGYSGAISYSSSILNKASVISTTSNGQLQSISIVNEGFGYSLDENISVLIEDEPINIEKISSIAAKGDFGIIKNIDVYPTGDIGFSTNSPAIEFTLQSKNYQTQILSNMEYSPIQVGDFFIISDSNVVCGHALTGITTNLGGMANYPSSKVGTAITFIDGVYRAENVVTDSETGISTVRCFFAPTQTINGEGIDIEIGINTTEFYGNYSFGIIYEYQDRSLENPKSFIVDTDNGLVGINTGPIVYRTRPVK